MRRFEYVGGTSEKFWEIDRDGARVTVRFGRRGTSGQTQVKEFGSESVAHAHMTKQIAEKVKKGYAETEGGELASMAPAADDGDPGPAADPIGVQPGMKQYMSESSGACRIVVRNADDAGAAEVGLRRFRADLWDSELFATLDGEFGDDLDGTPLRYTPSYATEVQVGTDGPEFWFDAQDVLETWPEVVGGLIDRLRQRLREAGVQRAQIGRPRAP